VETDNKAKPTDEESARSAVRREMDRLLEEVEKFRELAKLIAEAKQRG
jgi:hypothetical protein